VGKQGVVLLQERKEKKGELSKGGGSKLGRNEVGTPFCPKLGGGEGSSPEGGLLNEREKEGLKNRFASRRSEESRKGGGTASERYQGKKGRKGMGTKTNISSKRCANSEEEEKSKIL